MSATAEDLTDSEKRQLELAPFHEMNARAKREGRKVDWEDRLALARRTWPDSPWTEDEWYEALVDVQLMGAIIRDIIEAQEGTLDFDSRAERTAAWQRFRGQDYATCSFQTAFRQLATQKDGTLRSMSNLSHKTGLPRSRCHRLITGEIGPTAADMEAVAAGFGRSPAYFAEYRAGFVVAALARKLETVPDVTIQMYRQLAEATG